VDCYRPFQVESPTTNPHQKTLRKYWEFSFFLWLSPSFRPLGRWHWTFPLLPPDTASSTLGGSLHGSIFGIFYSVGILAQIKYVILLI
jgi:hypothetical protein